MKERKNHDYMKDVIAAVASTAGYNVETEVYRIVGLACHKSQARLLLDRLNNLDGSAQRQKAFQRKSKLAVIGVDTHR